MDVPFVIRRRLAELGLEQKDLARAARVTESYISQLLTRKRLPPAPDRSDIYDRLEKLLELPDGELAKLAGLQRKEELKRELGEEPAPLFREVRELSSASAGLTGPGTSGRSSRSSRSASSSAWSPKSCSRSSSARPGTSSTTTAGCAAWRGRAAGAWRMCG